jgi:hypothetical protein
MSMDDYPSAELMKGKISDTESRIVRVDKSTHSLQVIDYAHHEIHSGSHYFYDSHHDIAKAGVAEHIVITPDTTKWAHMVMSVESTAGQILLEVFRGATVSANGTLETAINRNGNYADASTTLIYETPTVTGDGTLIRSSVYGTGKNSSTGGGDRGSSETVLKQNTIYLLRITEQNILATTVNINFDWYEHTDRT